ncbi:uncharacterized protein B0I36DRAFT_364937 [Microdochium trichocladiopsis]|uniref:Uncharacterized protein n=1 Tax=Microdochium trichocladiopsis TaxID=1682393 RepID=A0A9P8Y2Q8_9PEZI|nr:uncharacterized protein B0I36DRAFT_364937 [Microdochium trichocladiopsis]KAH7027784.1 hypothetical protein B0I36DRAFT_364937 [Microdochium trichocladiopsis]
MRSLGPASHCSLDTSSDLSLTSSTSRDSSSRPSFRAHAKHKPPAASIATAPRSSSAASTTTTITTTITSARASSAAARYAALTDAHAPKRPRALRPALHQQPPSARSSVRSTSDSLQPPAGHSPSPASHSFERARKRSSLSPQPGPRRSSAVSARSSSNSSGATSSGRSVSATLSSSTSSNSTLAAKSRRSLAPTSTATTNTSDRRERRSSGISTTTPTASAPPSVARPSSAASLAHRGAPTVRLHNGALRTSAPVGFVKQAPLGVSRTPIMPTDRPGQGSAPVRPTMPTLSASAMRPSSRAPLMPKVAAKGHQAPALAPSAMTTPVAKRFSHPKIGTTNHHDVDSPSADTPAPYLAAHVTPRSGTRQVRVDSANSTPNGTPNLDRQDGWDPLPGSTAHLSNIEAPNFRKSTDYGNVNRIESPTASDSKFFHASDVKTSLPRPAAPHTKQTPSKPPTFFYANGNTIGDTPPPTTQSAPALAQQTQNDVQSKFLYANGVPELRPSPPVSRGSSSGVSGLQPKSGGRPSSGLQNSPQLGGHAVQRPHSPVKLAGQTPHPLPKMQAIPSGTPPRSHVTSPQPAPPKRSSMRRTSSGTSSWTGGHSRTGSLVSVEHVMNAPRFTSPQLSPHFATEPVSPLHAPSTPAPLTLASIIQAADEFDDGEPSEGSSTGDAPSEDLQSPTKSAQTPDPINELVANARRERKVQDLEITNASLEAINRTLERQLKKQTAEIRRFKRMSRTGRLSMASAGLSSRASSEFLNGEQAADLSLADLSEEGPELDVDLADDSFSDSESTSESLTPSIIAERDSRHRKRDEKRLRLDLTKHQEILVDSQKLNQSILRCMSWTEELIKEGQKALDYHVRVSEVKIGGRILDPLDEEEDTFDSAALDSGNLDLDATLAELDDIAADLDRTL